MKAASIGPCCLGPGLSNRFLRWKAWKPVPAKDQHQRVPEIHLYFSYIFVQMVNNYQYVIIDYNYYSKLRWLLERIAYLPPILGSHSLVWTWLRSHGLFHPCKTWRSYTLMPDPTNTPPGFGKWSSCLIAQCPLLRVKIPLPGSVYTSLVRWTAKIMFVDKWWICGWLMLITYIYIHIQNHHMVKSESPKNMRTRKVSLGLEAIRRSGSVSLRWPGVAPQVS